MNDKSRKNCSYKDKMTMSKTKGKTKTLTVKPLNKKNGK